MRFLWLPLGNRTNAEHKILYFLCAMCIYKNIPSPQHSGKKVIVGLWHQLQYKLETFVVYY